MIYAIDIDNTICRTDGMDYAGAQPIAKRIRGVNHLFDSGHTIVMATGRNWSHLSLTKKQLEQWGVKYHQLVMGQFPADRYVNDRMFQVEHLEEV